MDDLPPGSLVAAGGWCAPTEATYDIFANPDFYWDCVDWDRVRQAFETGVVPELVEPDPWYWLPTISFSRGNHLNFDSVQSATTLGGTDEPEHQDHPGRARRWRARRGGGRS